MVLADHLAPESEDTEALTAFLERQVEAGIKKALSRHSSPKAPKLPLVRLRVRLSLYPNTLNLAKEPPNTSLCGWTMDPALARISLLMHASIPGARV